MTWSCVNDHIPTLIGESMYCTKCGSKLSGVSEDLPPAKEHCEGDDD